MHQNVQQAYLAKNNFSYAYSLASRAFELGLFKDDEAEIVGRNLAEAAAAINLSEAQAAAGNEAEATKELDRARVLIGQTIPYIKQAAERTPAQERTTS